MKILKTATFLCALMICLISSVNAQNRLETDLVKMGSQPIKEAHYVWKLDLDSNRIIRQVNRAHHRPGGSFQEKEYRLVKPVPKDSLEGYTVHAYECETNKDSTRVELTLCFPKSVTDILIITEEVEIKSNLPKKMSLRTIFSTTPMTPEEKMEYAVYRTFINRIAAEGGDTIQAKQIWKENHKSFKF